MSLGGLATYGAIGVAAAVEGEIVFVAAAVLVAAGRLSPAAVLVAGALGAAAGDQFYFYALRGRASAWLARVPGLAARRPAIVARVRRHQDLMILALRFAPGLRITIAAACAYAGVAPLRFSLLNTLSAFAWAAVLLVLLTWIGPRAGHHAGLEGLWGVAIPGVLLLAFTWWISRR